MRFVIKPERGDPIILHDESEHQTIGWNIAENGIHDWFGTPEPREDAIASHSRDGGGWPPCLTQGPKTFSIDGIAMFRSTLEAARAKDEVNALFGQRLKVTCSDASGNRSLCGFLSDDPDPEFTPDEMNFDFTLVITCPYPIKSGDDIRYPVVNGYARVRNSGNANAYPKLVVSGNVTAASISYGGHTVSWRGNRNGLLIDLFEDLSEFSGITNDDAFSVPPGVSTIVVSVTGGTPEVILADAWR